MFDFIRGTLTTLKTNDIVVEANGIGYRISIPVSLLADLPSLGSMVQIYTSHVVRELAQQLYGFLSSEDRDLFETLITLSGIGPKTALAVISCLSLEQLHEAVQEEASHILAKVPGIGKKTAQRLLLDLRDKLPQLGASKILPNPSLRAQDRNVQDAMNALINLGYNQSSAQLAIKKALAVLPEASDLPLIITTALREV